MILNDFNTPHYYSFFLEAALPIKATIPVYTPESFLMHGLTYQALHSASCLFLKTSEVLVFVRVITWPSPIDFTSAHNTSIQKVHATMSRSVHHASALPR